MDFIKFKAQQREYLQRKLQIQNKIESLQREYNFIQKLNTDDVTYILDRKKEQAAIQIQRLYRKRIQSKKEKLAEELKLDKVVLTEEEIREIESRKRELKRLREKVQERRPDNFYTPIDEERKKELAEKVVQKKKLYIHSEMLKKNLEEIDNNFNHQFGDYMSRYLITEESRAKA